MTSYHVLMSDELMSAPDLKWPEGFRVVKPSYPGPDGYSRWWLVEDDNAPADLEHHRVEPVFASHTLPRTQGSHQVTVITDRHIVDEYGRRART